MTTNDTVIKNIEEVAANIYKFRLPMPFRLNHINAYLLWENKQFTLVDTGLPGSTSWKALTAAFEALNLKIGDLTDIFVTHSHTDHMGQLERIREVAPQARLRIHQRELEMLQERTTNPTEFTQRMYDWLLSNGAAELASEELGGNGRLMPVPTMQPADVAVSGGEKFSLGPTPDSEWQVMWTPGHTAGHFILHNASRRLMLSGDHLLGQISSNVGKYPGSTPDPLGDYLNSLQKIAALDLQKVLPAHGMPFDDYRERVAELTHHHHERLDKMYAAVEGKPTTAGEVVKYVWGDRLKDFDRYLALFETLSHLHRLVLDDKLVEEQQGGITYYKVA